MATSWLSDGQSWSLDMLEYHAGVSVTYYRGAGSTGAITAVAAEMEYEVLDREGYSVRFLSRDYFILKAALVIGGVTIEPREGDRIVEEINGVENTFRLFPVGSMPPAELRADGLRYRVHTKRVD